MMKNMVTIIIIVTTKISKMILRHLLKKMSKRAIFYMVPGKVETN